MANIVEEVSHKFRQAFIAAIATAAAKGLINLVSLALAATNGWVLESAFTSGRQIDEHLQKALSKTSEWAMVVSVIFALVFALAMRAYVRSCRVGVPSREMPALRRVFRFLNYMGVAIVWFVMNHYLSRYGNDFLSAFQDGLYIVFGYALVFGLSFTISYVLFSLVFLPRPLRVAMMYPFVQPLVLRLGF